MKKDNTKIIAIVLALLAIIVIILSFTVKHDKKKEASIYILRQPSDFFTVNSCLYRTITYVSKKDTDSLLKVLDREYKKKNKIDASNILNVFPNVSGQVTFVSKKMYYETIDNNIKKYYVKGIIKDNTLHDYTPIEKSEDKYVYFIVVMNSKKLVFSVEPYDGKVFMDGDSNE